MLLFVGISALLTSLLSAGVPKATLLPFSSIVSLINQSINQSILIPYDKEKKDVIS